ncbi:hypothetical protein F3J44_21355 [Pantoea sp. Tr-811]|uniref:hypothetical protein n=1 Tax=Pantoea sp. Tr-811 TaxID=2608361 RepID=UPI001420DA47|nr:hypothetical protein [Pantoea sp. Tr-811]NIF28915.1 hypothetical protein [Pantoea sp. Tr-811]
MKNFSRSSLAGSLNVIYPRAPFEQVKQKPRKTFVTTAAVSRAVYNAAYESRYTPSQIKRIWRLAGDSLTELDLRILFNSLVTRTDVDHLLSQGYKVTGEQVLMNSGRRCVAIRVLSETLHQALKAQRLSDPVDPSAPRQVQWSTFTYEVLSLLCFRGMADETLAEACLELDLGL